MIKLPELAELVNKDLDIKINQAEITNILKSSERYKNSIVTGFMSTSIEGNVDEIKAYIVSVVEARQAIAKAERAKQEEAEKAHNEELAQILITSGYSFEGYKIVKYSGYISGDDAVNVDRGFGSWGGNVGDKLMASLVVIRRNALKELKEAALALGCNAVIGVDFDYLTLDPQTANASGGTTYYPYVFGVTANGNAVVIEKE